MTQVRDGSRGAVRRFARAEGGSATLEFVIMVPVFLMLLFSSIDFGVVMLRQAYLDRAVDMTSREVRLGQGIGTPAEFRSRICARTYMLPDCEASIAVEMRPIDTVTWAGLNEPARCINRDEDITPMLEFRPGLGSQLMLIRACVVAQPFIRLTGTVIGMPLDESGRYTVVARSAWVNEPR